MTPSGEIAALATAVCWTFTVVFFQAAGRRIGSLSVNMLRLCIALVLLGVTGLFMSGRFLPLDAPAEAWLWLSLSGVVGFTFGDLFLFRAFVTVGARLATVVMMPMTPVLTTVFAYVALGETLEIRQWIGMALILAGVAWTVLERPEQTSVARRRVVTGVILALLGAVGQAGGLVLSKHGMAWHENAFEATQIRILAGMAGFAVVFTFIGWWPRILASLRDGRAMGLTAAGAVFGPFLGVSLSLYAVFHAKAGVASSLMSLVPVLVIPVVVIAFKEKVSPRAIGGAIVAVAGVFVLMA